MCVWVPPTEVGLHAAWACWVREAGVWLLWQAVWIFPACGLVWVEERAEAGQAGVGDQRTCGRGTKSLVSPVWDGRLRCSWGSVCCAGCSSPHGGCCPVTGSLQYLTGRGWRHSGPNCSLTCCRWIQQQGFEMTQSVYSYSLSCHYRTPLLIPSCSEVFSLCSEEEEAVEWRMRTCADGGRKGAEEVGLWRGP